jgi:uncharacterized protein
LKYGDDALMSDKKCMLLFIKFPEKGTVKSRLAKDIHEDSALSLYRNFVFDILKTLKTRKYQLKLCFCPPDDLDKVSAWLGKGYSYMPQQGKDLGERMKNAFRETFSEGFAKVLLIGSDIPDLTCTIIEEAYEFDNYDAVIGPSLDGGYYLIGFKYDTFSPEIFEGMHWGTDRIFRDTMDVLRKKRYRVHILPEKRDIDTLEDLRAFFEHNRNTRFADSGTMAFIRNNLNKLFSETKNC